MLATSSILVELFAAEPPLPEFYVPGLRDQVGPVFDCAPLAEVRVAGSGGQLPGVWRLWQHRSGVRRLFIYNQNETQPIASLGEPELKSLMDPSRAAEGRGPREGVLGPAPSLDLCGQADLLAVWRQAEPALFGKGERDIWLQYFVTATGIEFGRMPEFRTDPQLFGLVYRILSEADLAREKAGRLTWVQAPRAQLCAWLLQVAATGQQDGLADALELGPVEFLAELPTRTLEAIEHCLAIACLEHPHAPYRLAPADVMYQVLEPLRAELARQLRAAQPGEHSMQLWGTAG